jgi:hypothetical protein
VLVDARLNQRGSFNPADWSRAAHPAVDVCGELPGRRATRSFKTSDAASMPHLLADLRDATPDSWLPISTVET